MKTAPMTTREPTPPAIRTPPWRRFRRASSSSISTISSSCSKDGSASISAMFSHERRAVHRPDRVMPGSLVGRDGLVVLAALGMIVAALFVVARRVFGIVQKPSWPPTADAVRPADAQAATTQFASPTRARPRHVGIPYAWSTAATVDPWPEGRNFFPRILADVRSARSSIHVLMFGWREGKVGTEFADLLIEKLEQGVEVRVLVDAKGSRVFGSAAAMFTRLADAGAQIVVNELLPRAQTGLYPSERSFDWRRDDLGRVDHRKLYVIDGVVGWIGGAGLEDHFENGQFHD